MARDGELLAMELQVSGASRLLPETPPRCPAQLCCDHVFRLRAGLERKLWLNSDGSVKGWGLIMGWELIMQQVEASWLAVQPQTAGAQPLWAV